MSLADKLGTALAATIDMLCERVEADISAIDFQSSHPVIATDVKSGEQSELARLPAGPWITVKFNDDSEYAIWKSTGAAYRVIDGAVEDEPITAAQDDGEPREGQTWGFCAFEDQLWIEMTIDRIEGEGSGPASAFGHTQDGTACVATIDKVKGGERLS